MSSPARWLGLLMWCISASAEDLRIIGITREGQVGVTGAFTNGVVRLEKAPLTGPGGWVPAKSVFSIASAAELSLELAGSGSRVRAVSLDLSGNQGGWLLQPGDLVDLPSLLVRLRSTSGDDGVSEYVKLLLAPSTQSLLAQPPSDSDELLREPLLADFNALIQGKLLYDAEAFAAVSLSPTTLGLLDQNPGGAELIRLNRLLLEDAYPSELLQKRAAGYTNLVDSYGVLSTVAGSGKIICSACNSWSEEYEGGNALDAVLSSPHIAMADRAGNIYIADKRAHAIRKVLRDGTILTVAGDGVGGSGDTNAAPATSISLNNPNGIWVREDGSFYILDRDNGLIRRVDSSGIMTAVVDHGSAIPGGRGLWVNADETMLLYSAGSRLMSWDRTNGLSTYASGFAQLGNIAVDPKGNVVVTDSDRHVVIRLEADGSRTVIAGNGLITGGGDGRLATETGLYLVRAICFLPNGAFLVGTDGAGQVWYVDTEGHIHLFLNGTDIGSHAGDGSWFYDSVQTPKLSAVKQITMDYEGNLLITESVEGYIRKVPFLPRP